ncbi:hypothetical protein BDV40DRAFT_118878 [Aspergillus tamarii]|uniref:Uncharacterized protein n=1 Tax=Aspergillus tamarii TaxID=41984 RepID=A0A5N6UAA4_ASPTM|nr:hypothetical protein BDV40DRAFT_118878 [Aspergillus tamarii]
MAKKSGKNKKKTNNNNNNKQRLPVNDNQLSNPENSPPIEPAPKTAVESTENGQPDPGNNPAEAGNVPEEGSSSSPTDTASCPEAAGKLVHKPSFTPLPCVVHDCGSPSSLPLYHYVNRLKLQRRPRTP